MSVEDELRAIIAAELADGLRPGPLGDQLPLIEQGLIDSLGIFQLISFLEDRFGIAVTDEELVAQNFGTIAAIARFVRSKPRRTVTPTPGGAAP